MTEFNDVQKIKRRFFAMRNGVVADTLRRSGAPFRIIFGLNLPQLVEIAEEFGRNAQVAEYLWNNTTTRESQLLAPMLMDPAAITIETACRMAADSKSMEVADVLCHRLLRKHPDALALGQRMVADDDVMVRYCAMRILWHQLHEHPAEVIAAATTELERDDMMTKPLAAQIIEEANYL